MTIYHYISLEAGCACVTPQLNTRRIVSSEHKPAQMVQNDGRQTSFQNVAYRADIIH